MNNEAKLLAVLSRHVGRHRAVGMDVLYESVFGETAGSKINGTRALRKMITSLRQSGVPIASCSSRDGGGYYLAAAGSELEDYLRRLRARAVRALALESRIRNISLDELVGQVQLNLRGDVA